MNRVVRKVTRSHKVDRKQCADLFCDRVKIKTAVEKTVRGAVSLEEGHSSVVEKKWSEWEELYVAEKFSGDTFPEDRVDICGGEYEIELGLGRWPRCHRGS